MSQEKFEKSFLDKISNTCLENYYVYTQNIGDLLDLSRARRAKQRTRMCESPVPAASISSMVHQCYVPLSPFVL